MLSKEECGISQPVPSYLATPCLLGESCLVAYKGIVGKSTGTRKRCFGYIGKS